MEASLEQKPCCKIENSCLDVDQGLKIIAHRCLTVIARSPCDEAIHSCFLACGAVTLLDFLKLYRCITPSVVITRHRVGATRRPMTGSGG
jgi:hypothetical protein